MADGPSPPCDRRAAFGDLGEELVESDLLMRALRIPEKSSRIFGAAEAKYTSCLKAFADGVNQYINTHPSKLPLEFSLLGYKPETWEPEHCLNLIGYMGWDLAGGWSEEIIFYKIAALFDGDMGKVREVIPDYSHQPEVVFDMIPIASLEMETPLLRAYSKLRRWACLFPWQQ